MTTKILFIDKEPDTFSLIAQAFDEKIIQGEIEFIFSESSLEAFQILKDHPDISLVFIDINMPVMDGITLLAKIKILNPLIKTIIISPFNDMENIRRAMNEGAFDFIIKPLNFDDMRRTIEKSVRAINETKGFSIDHQRLLDIELELDFARKIQEAFIPHDFNPIPDNKHLEIYGKMIPAKGVGGDFFDFFPIAKNRLAFMIGDVSGKGIPAAFFMSMVKTAIRCFAMQEFSLISCLDKVNQFIFGENESSMFVTLFFGVLDTDNGLLEYCNAGHNPPYILSKGGNLIDIGRYEGTPLGVFQKTEYKTNQYQLKDNDCLVCYTDGVTEAMDTFKQMYSESRLKDLLLHNIDKPMPELVNSLVENLMIFSKDVSQFDDITILCIRYKI